MNTKNNFKWSITSLVVAVPILLCISYVLTSAQPVQKTTAPSLKHLETLTEDLIDLAANRNSDAVINALKALKEGASALGSERTIGAEKTKELMKRITKMEELWHRKKVDEFIIEDNHLFLEFVDLLYKSGPQDTPREVVYLDYLARELQYRPKIKDWKATERAIREIENAWRSLSSEIKTKALSSLFETTIARLPEVLRKRDGGQLYFIGQLILDEVDLLENYFKKPL
jgi:hypothetical protein